MESNIKRVPLRLNLDNPEHREIWELMESLKPEFHISKTSFIRRCRRGFSQTSNAN